MAKEEKQRLGLFGGSFDPVHLGHINLAKRAIEQAGLDRLYFVPANRNPHKEDAPIADAHHRLAMLRLAIADDERLGIWEGDLTVSPPSYSIDTVTRFKQKFPQVELFWLIGSDNLADLYRWKCIEVLARQVTFLVLPRAGYPTTPPQHIPHLGLYTLNTPKINMSATKVRKRLATNLPVRPFLAEAVYQYIEDKKLYR